MTTPDADRLVQELTRRIEASYKLHPGPDARDHVIVAGEVFDAQLPVEQIEPLADELWDAMNEADGADCEFIAGYLYGAMVLQIPAA